MSDIVICKDESGKLAGQGEKGRRAWLRFKKVIDEMQVGDTLGFSYRKPRSPPHHRYFFAKITSLFERQDSFDDFDRFMEFLKVGAGHVDFFPTRDGTLVAVPKSISWESLEENGFIEFTRALNDFLWQPHAQQALWPHLSEERRYQCIDRWHRDFQNT